LLQIEQDNVHMIKKMNYQKNNRWRRVNYYQFEIQKSINWRKFDGNRYHLIITSRSLQCKKSKEKNDEISSSSSSFGRNRFWANPKTSFN
jgi:hypothetical protein